MDEGENTPSIKVNSRVVILSEFLEVFQWRSYRASIRRFESSSWVGNKSLFYSCLSLGGLEDRYSYY